MNEVAINVTPHSDEPTCKLQSCGKPLSGERHGSRKYCGAKCYQKNRSVKQGEEPMCDYSKWDFFKAVNYLSAKWS